MSSPSNLFIFYVYFCNSIVPVGFLTWEIQLVLRGGSYLRHLCYPTYSACWVFLCLHHGVRQTLTQTTGPLMCANVKACYCTWGCTDTVRESALKADGEKSFAALGNTTCISGGSIWCPTNWATSSLLLIITNHQIFLAAACSINVRAGMSSPTNVRTSH